MRKFILFATILVSFISCKSRDSESDAKDDAATAVEWQDSEDLPSEEEGYIEVSCEPDRCFYRGPGGRIVYVLREIKEAIMARKGLKSSPGPTVKKAEGGFFVSQTALSHPSRYREYMNAHPKVQSLGILFTDPQHCPPCQKFEPLLNKFADVYANSSTKIAVFDVSRFYSNGQMIWSGDFLDFRKDHHLIAKTGSPTWIPALLWIFRDKETKELKSYALLDTELFDYFENLGPVKKK